MTFLSSKHNCSFYKAVGHTFVCKAGRRNCNYKVCRIKEVDIPTGVKLW